MDTRAATIVYTDGACAGNPGPGGWAWAVPGGPWATGAESPSTNQRMEIRAALEAVTAIDGPIEIVSDSTYVVNCFRDRWWEKWLAKGWVNSARQPVANRDLWEPLIDCVRSRGNIRFRWVKGHAGDVMNDLVDRLAVEAARTQRGAAGATPPSPEELGPPDLPGRRAAAGARGTAAAAAGTAGAGAGERDPRLPPGRLVLVAGHRPPALGGYGDNPIAAWVR